MPNFQIPQLRQNQVAIVVGALGIVLVVVVAYFFFRKPSANVGTPVTLTVWGTEPRASMQPLLDAYRGLRPNVAATYTEIDPAEYDTRLLNALAAGAGPDVFTMRSTDVGAMKDKLAAAPVALTTSSLSTLFPKAVATDAGDGGSVYALPLALDTLVLLYNRDLLDAAGIVAPPATWDEVVDDIPRLTAVDDQNQVQRAAIALGGTSASVPDAADILSLLMLQDGAPLSNAAHSTVTLGEQGLAAVRFYTQFANPASTAYTWNDDLGDAYQLFADGKLAMLVGYPEALTAIKERNAFIDARVAAVPQATGGTPKSFGSYPMLGVSKQSKNATWGWDLVQNSTTNKGIIAAYLGASGRTPALTTLIGDAIKTGGDAGTAATQALQARSWFQWDGAGVRAAVDRAVSDITSGATDPARATQALEQRLQALIP